MSNIVLVMVPIQTYYYFRLKIMFHWIITLIKPTRGMFSHIQIPPYCTKFIYYFRPSKAFSYLDTFVCEFNQMDCELD